MQAPYPFPAQATPGAAQPLYILRGETGVPYPDPRSAAAVMWPAADRAPAPQAIRATAPVRARHAAPEPYGRPATPLSRPLAHPRPPVPLATPSRTRWPLFADALFRLAHHDATGRPLLHSTVAGLGWPLMDIEARTT